MGSNIAQLARRTDFISAKRERAVHGAFRNYPIDLNCRIPRSDRAGLVLIDNMIVTFNMILTGIHANNMNAGISLVASDGDNSNTVFAMHSREPH